jgi:hypothetical protein
MTADAKTDQLGMGLMDLKGAGFDANEALHQRTQLVISGLVLGLENPDIGNSTFMSPVSDPLVGQHLSQRYSTVDYGLYVHQNSKGNKVLVVTNPSDVKKTSEETMKEINDQAQARINGEGSLIFLRAGRLKNEPPPINSHDKPLLRETQRFGIGGHEYLGTVQIMQAISDGMPFSPLTPKPER